MQLCNPKIKVLCKEQNKPVFGEEEKIWVNPKFTSNSIRMSLIPQKTVKRKTVEPTAEESAAQKQINKERQFVVQANAVKIMKAKKQYRYMDLLTEVIRNINMFKADPKMVKEQIEVLIRDEYMKRDDKEKALLIYLP